MIGLSLGFLLLVSLLVTVGAACYVYRDAKQRRMNAGLWTLIVALLPFLVGMIVYLVCREPNRTYSCPACATPVAVTDTSCSNCGALLNTVCSVCKQPIQPEWKRCPSCGETLPEGRVVPQTHYEKDRSTFAVVGGIALVLLVCAIGASVIFLRGKNEIGETQTEIGVKGMGNICAEDMKANATIAEWIAACDKKSDGAYLLVSERDGETDTLLLYLKGEDALCSVTAALSIVKLSWGEDREIDFHVESSQYENIYGYRFFLFEWEATNLSLATYSEDYAEQGKEVSITHTTEAIDRSTWGGEKSEK